MCDVLWGCVTEGGGPKLAKNSLTYFMNGPCNETLYKSVMTAPHKSLYLIIFSFVSSILIRFITRFVANEFQINLG